jgi:hypothetical protein
MTNTEFLRRRILERANIKLPNLPSLMKTEKSDEFERLRMNRKVLGAMRYGLLGSPGKPNYDRVSCMIRRLNEYLRDKNAEHLVDVANLAELEFVEGKHNGVIPSDDGIHTEEI